MREQNRDFPAGRIGREPTPHGTELTIPVITRGRMSEVKEFEDMIVRAYPDGSMVRMRDVARVELGAQSYDLQGRWNGKPNTFLLTFLAPGANALDTVRRVREETDKLAKSFPAGVSYDIPYDTTTFIHVSFREVVKTLGEAMLVILVVFLFLQSWRRRSSRYRRSISLIDACRYGSADSQSRHPFRWCYIGIGWMMIVVVER